MGNYLSNSLLNGVLKGATKSTGRKRRASSEEGPSDVKRFRLGNKCDINCAADITLLAFDREWPCHRSVLAQSDYFHALINGPFKESKFHEIRLHTTSDEHYLITELSFAKLLDVMYGRDVSFVGDDIFHFVVTAQYFQMHSAVEFCEVKIVEMLRSSNCIDIYHFAERYFLQQTRESAFQWMLLRLFPVKCWDQLSFMTIDLVTQLLAHPRLVTPNEMYLYLVLRMQIQVELNASFCERNEAFYGEIRRHPLPFLLRKEGKKFKKAFDALRLENVVVKRENVEILIRDNIIPRTTIESCIFKNWMSLISIESPENFGPMSELVSIGDFEASAMRFAKIIESPDYHSWKFLGFSYAFDLAMFFDGRALIVKRVHQINEYKISHSNLVRRIMIRWNIAEMNSTSLMMEQNEVQTLRMTTNEEICLRQLTREPKYPCRISIEVLFHVPYKSTLDIAGNDMMIDRSSIVPNTSILKTSSIPSRAFKRFFS